MKLHSWFRHVFSSCCRFFCKKRLWKRELVENPLCVIMVDGGFCSVLVKFALGLSIARDRNVTVKYDLSWFHSKGVGCDGHSNREFTLTQAFPAVNLEEATEDEIYWTKKIHYQKNQFPFVFDASHLTPKSKYLDGYFYHWKYLDLVKAELFRLLRFDELELDDGNESVKNHITQSRNSIAIHVRRGDFISVGNAILTPDYYLSALSFLVAKRELKDPAVFFFSDDPEWVRESIVGRIPEGYDVQCVDVNDQSKGFLDLYLISLCKYQISSNSSFGVWGGFLNQDVDKEVIIPSVWYDASKERRSLEGHAEAFRMPGWTVFSVDDHCVVEDSFCSNG